MDSSRRWVITGGPSRMPVWYVAVVAVILVASACGSEPTPSETGAPATTGPSPEAVTESPFPTEPVTITMWVTADGITKPTFEGYAEEYRQLRPNVTIEIEEFPFLDMHDKLTVALQSGTGAPDTALVEISRFGSLLKGDIGLVDLTDRIAATGIEYVPALQNNYTYQGRVYAYQFDLNPVLLFYRNDIFAEAGIEVPIQTWDDYVEAGLLLKEKTGASIMAIETTDYDVWTPLMLQYGCDFFDTDGNVTLDAPECHKAFNFLVDLVQKYEIAIPAPGGDQYNPTFWGAYQKGDVAAIWGAGWMEAILQGFVPDLEGKWTAQPLPTDDPDAPWPTSTVGGSAVVITEQAENVEVAWDWVRFLMERKPQPPVFSLSNNQAFWGEDIYHQPDPYLGGQVIGELWLELGKILLEPGAPYLNPNPNNTTAYDIFTRTALGPAINGEKSADEALADAAAELQATVGQ